MLVLHSLPRIDITAPSARSTSTNSNIRTTEIELTALGIAQARRNIPAYAKGRMAAPERPT